MKTNPKSKATPKNLLMLTCFEERMEQTGTGERYDGYPVLTTYDLRPGERYHAERLVRLGFLRKTRAMVPWYGSRPVTLYWRDEACRANPFSWRDMSNRRMQAKLASGEAVDVSGCPRSAAGEYLLGRVDVRDLAQARNDHKVLRLAERDALFAEGKDYCNAAAEAWVWSIGVHRETGEVWASHRANKYRNAEATPAFVCVWLR